MSSAKPMAPTSRPGSWLASSSSSAAATSSSSTPSRASAGRCWVLPSVARPRRALGFEIEPRWAGVYEAVVAAAALGAGRRAARSCATSATSDPGGPRTFDPSGCRMLVGDAAIRVAELDDESVDLVATDPPYNPQLRITMSGGPLAERHANRRTDYAMVSDDPADLANSESYERYLERMGSLFGQLRRVLRERRYAVVIVRDAYQEGRYRFVASDLRGPGSAARARRQGRPHLVPGWHAAAPLRLSARLRAQHRAPAHPRAARGVVRPSDHPSRAVAPAGDRRARHRWPSRPWPGRRRRWPGRPRAPRRPPRRPPGG